MAAVMASSTALQPAPMFQQQLLSQPQAQAPERLAAYTKVMRIFMQGSYDLAKEEALASLRSALAISEQEHLSVKAAAMADAQHHLQLHSGPSHACGTLAQEPSVAHSSQPPTSRGAGAGAKRPSPASGSKVAATPRKRTRASDVIGGASRAGARAQATGPASPAPRAAPGMVLDPLVGHVVMRHWPSDGGWFQGVVSDFSAETGDHCIIYDLGSTTESFEWYKIRGASQQDCVVQDEKVDFASLAPAAPAAAAPAAKGRKAMAGAAAGAPPRTSATSKQLQGSGGSASKAGASRTAGAAKPTGVTKAATARAAAAKPVAKPTPPPVALQPAVQPPLAAVQQQQQPRNGKTHSHHNGLTSQAAAVKQVLAAGGRPPYLNGHTLLPRRTRSWSSDEDSSDDDDE